jgi:hypothetical protein
MRAILKHTNPAHAAKPLLVGKVFFRENLCDIKRRNLELLITFLNWIKQLITLNS